MSELNKNFGATSPKYATSWSREILFQNFSGLPVGKLNQIKLNFSFRHSIANTSTTAHIKIFSGLNKNWTISNWTNLPASSWWQTRNNTHEYAYASDSMNNGSVPGGYQYKSETASNFITTVLAEGDFSITRMAEPQANVTVVFSGDQIKQTELSNWNQTLYLAIYSKDDASNTKWIWPANFTPTVTFNYSQESNGSLTSSTVNLGSSSTINIIANNSSYSHKVCWFCGDKNSGWKTVSAGTTSYSYSIPKDWGEVFPSSNNYPGTVQLETYSENSLIGTKTLSITYSVPDYSIEVSASISYIHDYSFGTTRYFSSPSFDNKRNFLTDRTTANCIINVTTSNYALYGASISNYTTRQTDNSGNIISSSSSFSIKGNISYNDLYIAVTDSRGKIGTYTLSLNKVSYSPPIISKIEAYRITSISDTTKDEIGGLACLVKVILTEATSPINGVTNSTICKIKIGDNKEVTDLQSVVALDADSSTTYTVTVTDTAGTKIVQTGIINSTNYLMHFRKNILSMGIGCAAPTTNKQLDIAWSTNINFGELKVPLLRIRNSTNLYPAIAFHSPTIPPENSDPTDFNNLSVGVINCNTSADSRRIYFEEYPLTKGEEGEEANIGSGAERLREQYWLPKPSNNLTKTVFYNIHTTKTVIAPEYGGTGINAKNVDDLKSQLGIVSPTKIIYSSDGSTPEVENGALLLIPIST